MTDDLPALHRPGPLPSPMPQLDSSPWRWMRERLPDSNDRLPSVAEEAVFRREVEAANAPISVDALQTTIGRLVSSFPQKRDGDDRGLILAYAEFLAEYPADVVDAARRQVVRTSRFMPSVAELVEVCEELVAPRRTARTGLNIVARERERRRKAAERDKLEGTVRDGERVLYRLARERVKEAAEAANPEYVPLDNWNMGLPPEWWRRLIDAARHDVRRDWGSAEYEPIPILPETAAAYASWCEAEALAAGRPGEAAE